LKVKTGTTLFGRKQNQNWNLIPNLIWKFPSWSWNSGSGIEILDLIWKFWIWYGNSGSDLEIQIWNGNSGVGMKILDNMTISILIWKFRFLPEFVTKWTRKWKSFQLYFLFVFLLEYNICKISEPYDNPFLEKSKWRRRKRKKCH
jgi:hypothetical protein